jgi:preprotein translocase subunit SecE
MAPRSRDVPRRLRTCSAAAGERASFRQFFREVRDEMRQVAWPTRPETLNYTSITLFVLIFMSILIFGLSFGFSKFVSFLVYQVGLCDE